MVEPNAPELESKEIDGVVAWLVVSLEFVNIDVVRRDEMIDAVELVSLEFVTAIFVVTLEFVNVDAAVKDELLDSVDLEISVEFAMLELVSAEDVLPR